MNDERKCSSSRLARPFGLGARDKAAPKGRPAPSFRCTPHLNARLAIRVDGDRRPRRRVQLHAMFDPPEVVGYVPIVGTRIARDVFSPLNVAVVDSVAT